MPEGIKTAIFLVTHAPHKSAIAGYFPISALLR
jgi:hypothetical protein